MGQFFGQAVDTRSVPEAGEMAQDLLRGAARQQRAQPLGRVDVRYVAEQERLADGVPIGLHAGLGEGYPHRLDRRYARDAPLPALEQLRHLFL